MRYQLSKEAVASPQCIWMSKFAPNRASHCCAVTVPQQHLGTDFFLNPSSSVNTKRTVSRLIFTSSAIILTVNLRSDRTGSLTHAVLSPVPVFDGRPLCCSSSATVLPSGVPRNFVRGEGGSKNSVEDR